jgi:hypothetical protein
MSVFSPLTGEIPSHRPISQSFFALKTKYLTGWKHSSLLQKEEKIQQKCFTALEPVRN